MRYLNQMGYCWRLGERAYRRMLKDTIASGYVAELESYGGKLLGKIESVTDLGASEAGQMLEDVVRKAKVRKAK